MQQRIRAYSLFFQVVRPPRRLNRIIKSGASHTARTATVTPARKTPVRAFARRAIS